MTRTVELLNAQSMDEDENETNEKIETEEEIINIGHTVYHMQCAVHMFRLGTQDALKKDRKSSYQRLAKLLSSYILSSRHCFVT